MSENTIVRGTSLGNLEKSGSEKDWSKWIEDNKTTLIIAFALIVVAIFGGGYIWNSRNKSKEIYNAKIYNFEKTDLVDFAKSGNAQGLVASLKALHATTGDYVGLIPAILKSSDALYSKGQKNEALEVLTMGKSVSRNEYVQFFINTRLAVVYEDLGKNQEAVDVLTALTSSDVKVFEGKTYLDLGRVYLKLGNKEKAKASFQYVLDKAKDDAEFVKIAKLQLANL